MLFFQYFLLNWKANFSRWNNFTNPLNALLKSAFLVLPVQFVVTISNKFGLRHKYVHICTSRQCRPTPIFPKRARYVEENTYMVRRDLWALAFSCVRMHIFSYNWLYFVHAVDFSSHHVSSVLVKFCSYAGFGYEWVVCVPTILSSVHTSGMHDASLFFTKKWQSSLL